MNHDDERKDIPLSSDTEEANFKQMHGERKKSGRLRRFVLFRGALWRAIVSWRPHVKLDIGRIKAIVSRPDFPRIAIYAAIGLWLLGTIIAGLKYVKESEVGVKVANVTGRVRVYDAAGLYIHNPYLSNFYVLDKTVHSLDMSYDPQRLKSTNEVRIKTNDGSNVSLNVTINYKIIATKADTVFRIVGREKRSHEEMVATHSRASVIQNFGSLSSEEFYNTSLRNEKAHAARDELNGLLHDFGFEVVSVIPRDFRFYKEYEEVIKARKVADQSIEEQKAKAANAVEEQKRRFTEAESKANIKIAKAVGDAKRRIVEARGQANKGGIDADAYAYKTTVDADASLFASRKEAEGVLAMGAAEAKGYRQLAAAMRGSGGENLVALEYAKKLKDIKFTGTPVTVGGHVPRVDLGGDAAARQPQAQANNP